MGLTNMLKLFTLQVVPSIIISNIKTISEMQRIEFWAAGWEVQTLPQCYAAPSLPPKRSLVCCTLDGGSYPRCWRLGMNHINAGLRKQSHKSYDRHRDRNLDLRNKIILWPISAHIGPYRPISVQITVKTGRVFFPVYLSFHEFVLWKKQRESPTNGDKETKKTRYVRFQSFFQGGHWQEEVGLISETRMKPWNLLLLLRFVYFGLFFWWPAANTDL